MCTERCNRWSQRRRGPNVETSTLLPCRGRLKVLKAEEFESFGSMEELRSNNSAEEEFLGATAMAGGGAAVAVECGV
eukprot:Skav224023  [mRNA]  locus=scaffold3238:92164:92685:+ [translate_table: standard]